MIDRAAEPWPDAGDYVELVLDVVERIPPGQVMTYGDIADLLGRGGPRQVGTVLSRHGAGVPWWRVIRADGRPVRGLEDRALDQLIGEGCPVRGGRVQLSMARWVPRAT
jgi:methylated-DNA-protein-cysteine methyltransferase related protein